MRPILMIGLTAITSVAGAAWASAPATPTTGKPRCLTDFAAAQVEARRSERPILAVLH
jgi:hypothetical protein